MRESARVFDRLSYTKKLQNAGFTLAQAEAFLWIVKDDFVSKDDLQDLSSAALSCENELS